MKKTLLALALAATSVAASASLTPQFDTFGPLPGATFGGSGIPNDAVAITTVGGVTLGLTATARFFEPTVTNNGAGRFFALPGAYAGTAGTTDLARWNFNWFIGGNTTAYTYEISIDIDPSANEDFKTFNPLLIGLQSSQNISFGYLETGFGYLFNPNASGEYSFKLSAIQAGQVVGTSSIVVQVPEPASLALTGAALLAAGAAARRRRA